MAQETRNPGTAAVLSFVFSGLGQIYNGQIAKGLWIIFASAINMLLLIIGSVLIGYWLLGKLAFGNELIVGFALFIVSLIFICIIAVYSILDAYNVALKK